MCLTGIKGKSILFELNTIRFPDSFPPDIMHLFFEGVTPAMYRHWSGNFFSKKQSQLNTNSSYYLKNSIWKAISSELIKNHKKMPGEFGCVPISLHYHKGYKAEDWMNWTILYSIPLLKDYLPSQYAKVIWLFIFNT